MIEAQEPKPEQLSGKCWSFEEALLDPEHCYTIAAQTDMEDVTTGSILDGSEVHRFDWKELLKNAVPYTDATR
ncbi:hypothetical protein BG011_006857 [Mortierella polycephala]|uniref:Uncharacterized protein n=1 Tax=Mortierella polycephala TaxID=41804 RepID=A0A9P6PUB2_9FUNG|nr:hypothetical protein BG011_006857 [Mortierella polycephala]